MVNNKNNSYKKSHFRKQHHEEQSIAELYAGVLESNRALLAKSITLIESNAAHHFEKGQQLLQLLLPHSGRALRIGITGVPGAGKSTFIESLGYHLCENGYKVAVLAIDPSSTVTGGSILGDKTRMEKLARHRNAFIRPSPSQGKLGGVHRKTRETMLLCEAAQYDVIFVETVGVGQSEVIVRGMVDFFLLLVLTGAGDELQGMKKGIIELADGIIVNKADGDNVQRALHTQAEYNQILHLLQGATPGWETRAHTCSALQGTGIAHIWDVIKRFESETKTSGQFDQRRANQMKDWMDALITDELQRLFFADSNIKAQLVHLEKEVVAGERTATAAVKQLFEAFQRK